VAESQFGMLQARPAFGRLATKWIDTLTILLAAGTALLPILEVAKAAFETLTAWLNYRAERLKLETAKLSVRAE